MEQVIELLKQRRVWAGIVGSVTFTLGMVGVTLSYDSVQLTDLLLAVGQALGALIPAVLALYSYLSPKK